MTGFVLQARRGFLEKQETENGMQPPRGGKEIAYRLILPPITHSYLMIMDSSSPQEMEKGNADGICAFE